LPAPSTQSAVVVKASDTLYIQPSIASAGVGRDAKAHEPFGVMPPLRTVATSSSTPFLVSIVSVSWMAPNSALLMVSAIVGLRLLGVSG